MGATYIPIDATFKKPNKAYSDKVNRSRGTNINYCNVRARVPTYKSLDGWAYFTIPEDMIEPSQYANRRGKFDIVNYHGGRNFYESKISVSFRKTQGYGPENYRHERMSPSALLDLIGKCSAITRYPKSKTKAPVYNKTKRIDLNIDLDVAHNFSKEASKIKHRAKAIDTTPHFKVGVTDVTRMNTVRSKKSITYTENGVTEHRAPTQFSSEYKNAIQMKKRIHNVAEASVKEFDKVVDYFTKFHEWAVANNVPTSIQTTPSRPNLGASDEETLSIFKKSINNWSEVFSSEISSLRAHGYDVPKEFYKIRTTVNASDEYTKMVQFNAIRGATYLTANGLTVNSNNNTTYMANVAGRYGISKHEAALLESGDYVVFTGVPSSSGKLAHYVGTLVPITDYQKNRLSGNQFDGYKASDLTHFIELEEIEVTDPRFANVEHNERYAMDKGSYDKVIERAKNNYGIDKPIHTTTASIVRTKPKTTHKAAEPTTAYKADNMRSKDYSYNQFSRRKATYLKLRTEPASDVGRQLGFETAWDEKRFFDSISIIQVLSHGGSITSHNTKLQLLEKAKDGYRDLVGFDKKNTKILNSFDANWRSMLAQADMRQRDPSPEAAAKGIHNAWEEKVVADYEAIVGKHYEGGIIPEEDRRIFTRYYRLQETLDIRKNGLISKADVGTSKDKYALLTVSGFYDKVSSSGLTYEGRQIDNRWEECKVTDTSIKDVINEFDDIPDFT